MAPDSDLVLAHSLQQRGLDFGGRAVDFVGKYQIVEQGARLEMKVAGFGAIDVGAGQVSGQQIGSELKAAKIALQRGRQLLDSSRLASPGAPSTSK